MKAQKVKYIRDYTFTVRHTDDGPVVHIARAPVACVVQDENGNCGVSICNHSTTSFIALFDGDIFSKEKARKIAFGRALIGSTIKIPTRKITNVFGKRVRICDEVDFWVNKFKERVNTEESV